MPDVCQVSVVTNLDASMPSPHTPLPRSLRLARFPSPPPPPLFASPPPTRPHHRRRCPSASATAAAAPPPPRQPALPLRVRFRRLPSSSCAAPLVSFLRRSLTAESGAAVHCSPPPQKLLPKLRRPSTTPAGIRPAM